MEAARLEAAIDFFEEMFNDAIAQGESRARTEFYSSKAIPTAQTASKEAVPEITTPEVTQPLIESSALSETSQTETAPEPMRGQAKMPGSATPEQKQVNQWPQRKSCSLD